MNVRIRVICVVCLFLYAIRHSTILDQAHEKGLGPKGTIDCAGYKVLSSMEEYLELLNNSLPGEGGCRTGNSMTGMVRGV